MVPLLALCLVLPIAASAQAPEFSGVNEFPIVKDKIELKVFARLDSNIADPATNVWTKHQERLTNVHIVWETVPNAAQNEKVNLLLASSNRPDIFFGVSGALSPTVQMVHGPTGTFVDLKPLIDEHGYWIKKMFEQVPYIEAAITAPDGAIYSLPQVNECFHCYYAQKMWINRTWLDKLGLEMPTTPEEFKQVLIAFRDKDPNGNGIKDEIPLMGSTNGWNARVHGFLMCAFTYTDLGDGLAIAPDGKTVELAYTKPEFREGLKYLPDLYKEGLIAEISTVVMVSILTQVFHQNFGIVNMMIMRSGRPAVNFMGSKDIFVHMYVWSGVWQHVGYASIMYIAVLSGIDPTLHEAAVVDGASLWKRIIHIDLPGVIPTATILFIMNCGSIMNVGFEKVFLMQNNLNLSASEVISTYVYKQGLQGLQFSYSAAIGLFNSAVNMIILVIVNRIARRMGETSLW